MLVRCEISRAGYSEFAENVVLEKARPHPCPLPQERENHLAASRLPYRLVTQVHHGGMGQTQTNLQFNGSEELSHTEPAGKYDLGHDYRPRLKLLRRGAKLTRPAHNVA